MKRINVLLLIPLLFVINMSCSTKRSAIGKENQIVVVVDSTLYDAFQPYLSHVFEREIRTPGVEERFQLSFLNGDELSRATIRHNVIMVGILNAPDKMSQQVTKMLNADLIDKVQSGEGYVFRKQNPWAEGQLLLVLAGSTVSQLQQNLEKNADYLYSLMHLEDIKRVTENIYSRYEQTDIEDSLLTKYGFRIRIPHDYHFFQDIPQNNFVHFRRVNPERWIYVHWVETDDPTIVLDREWFFQKRAEIGRLHYERDVVVDTLYSFGETEINGRWALQFEGLWENNEKVAGGAMKAFVFYDEDTHRAYIIDIAIYAPSRQNKLDYLHQLEAIARTFRTKADLEREKDATKR
ncbi:DUF4837 family protein [candidate division KSB1 bacterium]|nr:DUF4837 family protein [candidate division KSB1 bacterium]